MQTPTLRQLSYLVALAETGHFGEAAQRCAVSQPALSKQVREVEELLGVVLFERSRPRVLLTPAGEEVVRRARGLLMASQELVEAVGAYGGTHRGRVHLGVIPTVAPYGLAGLLTRLRTHFPEAVFAIRELHTDRLIEALREGRVDLALLARPFEAQGLEGPDLLREPFVLLAPADHPLGRQAPVEAAELAEAELILMEDGHCLRDQAIEVCARAGVAPSTHVAAASVATLARMVESGLGSTLLPASALGVELRAGMGLVARAFVEPQPGRTLTLQWRASSPHAAWFRSIGGLLQAHYAALNATLPAVAGATPRIQLIAQESG